MDGLAADIHGGKPGGREHHRLLLVGRDDLAQQRRLAGAGAAGQEDVSPAADNVGEKRRIDV